MDKNEARQRSNHELREVQDHDEVARNQLCLRRAGRETVLGVLAQAGERHSGTGGWQIIACVSPANHYIGWVNTARGRAYLSNVCLTGSMVEALTVPEQDEGAVTSGAPGFASAAVAGSRTVEIPDGWTQLLTDVRRLQGDSTPTEEGLVENLTWDLVAYGLRTCYEGRREWPVREWDSPDLPREIGQERYDELRAEAQAWIDNLEAALFRRSGREERRKPLEDPFSSREVKVAVTGYQLGAAGQCLRSTGVDGGAAVKLAGCRGMERLKTDQIRSNLEDLIAGRLEPVASVLGPVGTAHEDSPLGRGDRQELLKKIGRKQGEAELVRAFHEIGMTPQELERVLEQRLFSRGAVITEVGRKAGVRCTQPVSPSPVLTSYCSHPAYYVPSGAEAPAGYDHVAVTGTGYEIRIREEVA